MGQGKRGMESVPSLTTGCARVLKNKHKLISSIQVERLCLDAKHGTDELCIHRTVELHEERRTVLVSYTGSCKVTSRLNCKVTAMWNCRVT